MCDNDHSVPQYIDLDLPCSLVVFDKATSRPYVSMTYFQRLLNDMANRATLNGTIALESGEIEPGSNEALSLSVMLSTILIITEEVQAEEDMLLLDAVAYTEGMSD